MIAEDGRPMAPVMPVSPTTIAFPGRPSAQPVAYQLPLAQLVPLTQGALGQAGRPVAETGPAAVIIIASGAGAGLAFVRRRKKKAGKAEK